MSDMRDQLAVMLALNAELDDWAIPDARPLYLIDQFRTLPRDHARPLPIPCSCRAVHGHCWRIDCRCPRHRGETSCDR